MSAVFDAPRWIPAHVGDDALGEISLWVHAYAPGTRDRMARSPVAFPDLSEDLSVVQAAIHSAGLLDIEVVVPASFEVQGADHLVLYVGHRLGAEAVLADTSRGVCVVLEPRVVRDRCVWVSQSRDAGDFLSRQWRSANVWATLVRGRVSRERVTGARALRDGKGGPAVQWELALGYAQQWQAETFRGVTLDLLREVVPIQDGRGFRSSDAELQEALGEGLDLHVVLHGYRVAAAAEVYASEAQAFFRGVRARPPVEARVVGVEREGAQAYWTMHGAQRALHVYESVRRSGRVFPTVFSALQSQAIDPDVRVASSATRRVLDHVGQAIGRLEEVRAHEVHAAPERAGAVSPGQFVEAPTASLRATQVALSGLLRKAGLGPEGVRGDVPLEALRTASVRAGALRRRALGLGRGLERGAQELDPLELEATNAVYEAWCFLRVMGALHGLGFRRNAAGDRWAPPELYYAPKGTGFALVHPSGRLHGTLLVRKEPTYPAQSGKDTAAWYGVETRYDAGLTSVPDQRAGGLEPDVALEFRNAIASGPGLDIVVFDATSSNRVEAWRDKYRYTDRLRAFEGRVDERGGRVERDPQTGESPRLVRASWALCPGAVPDGGVKGADYSPGAHAAMPKGTAEQRHRHGFYVLTAREQAFGYEPFTRWLGEMLEGLGLVREDSA